MIGDAFAAIAMALLVLAGVVLQPSSAQCPVGWSLGEGVRRDGRFACYAPLPHGCGEPVGPEVPCPRSERWRARIYCTGGARPIVVDQRTVGCQRG